MSLVFNSAIFFANLLRVTSTGPTTIAGILEAHKSLCDQASSLLSRISQGEAPEVEGSRWPDPRCYKSLPLCKAIIVVLDQLDIDTNPDPDGFISLDKVSERQNLLIVRTGDEASLSAPISFEGIRGQSLPLARSDITVNDGTDVVRLPLAIAVRFIAGLNQREEAAFPNLEEPSLVDLSLGPSDHGHVAPSADAWADGIMQEAEEKGN